MENSVIYAEDEFQAMDRVSDSLAGKNWFAALTLCWALGMLGAQRFYTGRMVSGWIMFALTLSIVGMPVSYAWSIVDGIMIVFGVYKTEDGSSLFERNIAFGCFYILCMLFGILKTLLDIASIAASLTGQGGD